MIFYVKVNNGKTMNANGQNLNGVDGFEKNK